MKTKHKILKLYIFPYIIFLCFNSDLLAQKKTVLSSISFDIENILIYTNSKGDWMFIDSFKTSIPFTKAIYKMPEDEAFLMALATDTLEVPKKYIYYKCDIFRPDEPQYSDEAYDGYLSKELPTGEWYPKQMDVITDETPSCETDCSAYTQNALKRGESMGTVIRSYKFNELYSIVVESSEDEYFVSMVYNNEIAYEGYKMPKKDYRFIRTKKYFCFMGSKTLFFFFGRE